MTEKVNWPPASNISAWSQLDQDLDRVLEATLAGIAERKIDNMTTTVFTMARECFGTEKRKGNGGTSGKGPNRREREIKTLNKQFRRANAVEKEGIKELTTGFRGRLRRLRRAERSLKLRKEREVKLAHFIKDPCKFTKTLLG